LKEKQKRIAPKLGVIVTSIEKQQETKEPQNLSLIRQGSLPLVGLARDEASIAQFYKDGKLISVLEEYDLKRHSLPQPDLKEDSAPLMETLFVLSLDWTAPKGSFPIQSLRLITLYLKESLLFDNLYTVPTYPGDSKFDVRYYKGAVGDDMERSGYNHRRVDPTPYLAQSAKRQAELEAADASQVPTYSDALWTAWWSKKMKLKEEMYLAIKQRAFGVSE